MRMGVLDIGSNTGHLLIVDAHRGAAPIPAHKFKESLRLSEHVDDDGSISAEGISRLVKYVVEARAEAEENGCSTVLAFATSAVRDAVNADDVLATVRQESGVDVEVMPGEDEARLTFLAVRRWFGWSSGRLGVFDIGGGSLEIAVGSDEEPDVAQSLPLGAGRLTREWLDAGRSRKELRRHVRSSMAENAGEGPERRRVRPRRRHEQDVSFPGPHVWGRAVGRGTVRPPSAGAHRPASTGASSSP